VDHPCLSETEEVNRFAPESFRAEEVGDEAEAHDHERGVVGAREHWLVHHADVELFKHQQVEGNT